MEEQYRGYIIKTFTSVSKYGFMVDKGSQLSVVQSPARYDTPREAIEAGKTSLDLYLTPGALVTEYSNKLLELDGAQEMDSQEVPLILAEFARKVLAEGRF